MKESEKKILKREYIYRNIDKTFNRYEGIFLKKKIGQKDLSKLSNCIIDFIYKSVVIFNPKKKIKKKNFVNLNIDLITKLPNITPGGQLRGFKELIKEYNQIHNELLRVLKKIKLFNDLKRLAWFSVRVKKGVDTNDYKKRTYSTSKKHSDMWAGEKNHAKIILMLVGDIKNNSVNFYKPINFAKDTFSFRKKTFDEGLKKIKSIKYLGKAQKNELCLFDQYCLHKTYLSKKAKPRISLDLRVDISGNKIYNNKLSQVISENMILYKKKDWEKLNYKKIKYHNKSYKELAKLFINS